MMFSPFLAPVNTPDLALTETKSPNPASRPEMVGTVSQKKPLARMRRPIEQFPDLQNIVIVASGVVLRIASRVA